MDCADEEDVEAEEGEADEAALERKRCRVEALGRARGLRNGRYNDDFICVSAICEPVVCYNQLLHVQNETEVVANLEMALAAAISWRRTIVNFRSTTPKFLCVQRFSLQTARKYGGQSAHISK